MRGAGQRTGLSEKWAGTKTGGSAERRRHGVSVGSRRRKRDARRPSTHYPYRWYRIVVAGSTVAQNGNGFRQPSDRKCRAAPHGGPTAHPGRNLVEEPSPQRDRRQGQLLRHQMVKVGTSSVPGWTQAIQPGEP